LCQRYLLLMNDTAPTALYTLSLHDALPISARDVLRAIDATDTDWSRKWKLASPPCPTRSLPAGRCVRRYRGISPFGNRAGSRSRSEEHTSELQSRENLVCRLLLEKKKTYMK